MLCIIIIMVDWIYLRPNSKILRESSVILIRGVAMGGHWGAVPPQWASGAPPVAGPQATSIGKKDSHRLVSHKPKIFARATRSRMIIIYVQH